MLATREINVKTSSESDGVPGLVMKKLMESHPWPVLEAINIAVQDGQFLECWKEARLVLLPKAEMQMGIPGGYCPLCLLSTMGKVFASWQEGSQTRKERETSHRISSGSGMRGLL